MRRYAHEVVSHIGKHPRDISLKIKQYEHVHIVSKLIMSKFQENAVDG